MNKASRLLLSLLLLVSISLGGCSDTASTEISSPAETSAPAEAEFIDYASELKLDMSSDTLKQEVTVQSFVDGDTTHFNVPESVDSTGVLKARYLAVDTPESTGKIEEYGKAASLFTREKLENASSIIVESDNERWNMDSTGGRCLLWVWYREDESGDYRNLNLELLQNGYALASSTANNRYGDICMAALNQAKELKLNAFSGQPDPLFFYGDAIELSLRELRLNPEQYEGSKLAFSGVVTRCRGNGVFVQSYDAETDMYYGIYVYYGFNLSGKGLNILSVGNEVRIVGTLSFYENSGSYQISGLSCNAMKPDDPNNIKMLSEGNEPVFVPTVPEAFAGGSVKIGDREMSYADAAMDTGIEMKSLYVESAYTTTDESSSSYGAMTLSCSAGGVPVQLRTGVLYDENRELIGEETFVGKTIDVKGIVSRFKGEPQILVLSMKDIAIK